VLTGWQKSDAYSAESGTKYLLLASLASAFFIYGASLLFVKFGTTHLLMLSGLITGPEPLVLVGLLMLLVGFAFKVAAAPFHLWAPDVYQGAPISTVAFLSTASKAAGFAVLLRALTGGFFGLSAQWWALISIMAALSMLIGNLVALHQNNVKRMLAYSGIAQAGYILIAVGALGQAHLHGSVQPTLGMTAAILYLFLYTVGNIGAFAITGIVSREAGNSEMSAFAGLRWRAPMLAFAMALLLLSLGGIPLLAGFVGKWVIFLSAIYQGQYLLVLLGAALSVVSIYYYLLVIKQMYIIPAPKDAKPIRVGGIAALGLLIIVLLTALIGIYPLPFYELAKATATSLLGP
jgi:NADH-quinone oxidoreductase subunit N